jgi:hypothetical protein
MDVRARTTANRLRLGTFFDNLDDEQLATVSLCEAWSVREVLGHLVMPLAGSTFGFLRHVVRFRGALDRASIAVATELARRPVPELTAVLREHADQHGRAPGVGPMGQITDGCLHLRDCARPLGLPDDVELSDWRLILDWLPGGVPGLVPKRRLDGLSCAPPTRSGRGEGAMSSRVRARRSRWRWSDVRRRSTTSRVLGWSCSVPGLPGLDDELADHGLAVRLVDRAGPRPRLLSGSRSPVERRRSVRAVLDLPGGVVRAVVVERAEELAVGKVRLAALRPGLVVVVGLAPGGWHIAAVGGAGAVAQAHRLALRRGEEASGAAEVEDLALAAEDDGDDARLAGQPAGLFGRDPVAGGGIGPSASGLQGVEVKDHHHRCRCPAVLRQAVDGEVLQEGAERFAAAAGQGELVDVPQRLAERMTTW